MWSQHAAELLAKCGLTEHAINSPCNLTPESRLGDGRGGGAELGSRQRCGFRSRGGGERNQIRTPRPPASTDVNMKIARVPAGMSPLMAAAAGEQSEVPHFEAPYLLLYAVCSGA